MARFDRVIRGGMIVDGSRLPRFRGDIGIKDGLIAEIGHIGAGEADETIDAGGLIVAPWGPVFYPDCPIARLEVRADGTAEGRFHVPGWFMPLRDQQSPPSASDEAEGRWEAAGRPDVGRYGVMVTPEGQHVWLDRPENRVG